MEKQRLIYEKIAFQDDITVLTLIRNIIIVLDLIQCVDSNT